MDWPDPRLEGSLDDVAYIGLGSNLGDPREQVLGALSELRTLPGCTLVARSSLYATTPVGPIEQPDYVNAVAALAEIAPAWLEVPRRGRLADLLAACPQDARMRPIPEAPPKADKPGIPALSSPSA